MCSIRRIPPMARKAKCFRPPFRAVATSPAAIEVLDAGGMCAAITFPTECVVCGGAVQLGEAIADSLNQRFPVEKNEGGRKARK